MILNLIFKTENQHYDFLEQMVNLPIHHKECKILGIRISFLVNSTSH